MEKEIVKALNRIAEELKEHNRVLRRMCEASIFDRPTDIIVQSWENNEYLDAYSQE